MAFLRVHLARSTLDLTACGRIARGLIHRAQWRASLTLPAVPRHQRCPGCARVIAARRATHAPR